MQKKKKSKTASSPKKQVKQPVVEEDSQEDEIEEKRSWMGEQALKWAPILKLIVLLLIGLVAFMVRVFSVIRYESVIHEYDPWFNYRTTQYMSKEGLYGLWNWFDSDSWYPLGRVVGGTVYPGLMMTSSIIYWFL